MTHTQREELKKIAMLIWKEQKVGFDEVNGISPTFFFMSKGGIEYDVITTQKRLQSDYIGAARKYAVKHNHSAFVIFCEVKDRQFGEGTDVVSETNKLVMEIYFRDGIQERMEITIDTEKRCLLLNSEKSIVAKDYEPIENW